MKTIITNGAKLLAPAKNAISTQGSKQFSLLSPAYLADLEARNAQYKQYKLQNEQGSSESKQFSLLSPVYLADLEERNAQYKKYKLQNEEASQSQKGHEIPSEPFFGNLTKMAAILSFGSFVASITKPPKQETISVLQAWEELLDEYLEDSIYPPKDSSEALIPETLDDSASTAMLGDSPDNIEPAEA